MPLQIGVTGGIGAGKSVVCQIFGALGIPIYSADDRAKWLLNHDTVLKTAVLGLLGSNAYQENGIYNRAWVASQVFHQPALLQQLNALVHPRVRQDTQQWIQTHQNAPYLIKEAAIMAKAEANNGLDKVILVQAPVALRVSRTKQRDPHRTETEIKDITARQMPDDERLKIADFVVYNDETQLLIPQVWQLHQLFLTND
jgi:dephospho-CoA kinase